MQKVSPIALRPKSQIIFVAVKFDAANVIHLTSKDATKNVWSRFC